MKLKDVLGIVVDGVQKITLMKSKLMMGVVSTALKKIDSSLSYFFSYLCQ